MTTITINRATVEQALEAMRRAVPTGKITLYEWDKAVSDLDAALAQQAEPAQEPVAWRDSDNSDPGQGCTYDKAKAARWPHIYKQPLYTAPPQQAEPVPMPPFPPVSQWNRGCAVCGIGADNKAYGYVCPRSDCPTRVTCGGVV